MSINRLYQTLKAKRPAMSLELARAKSAQEVGELIADSWYGYGLDKQAEQSGDTYVLTVTTKPETFADAMKYLWLKDKGKNGGATIYRMAGMPYELAVGVRGEKHNITIRRITQ